MNTETKVGLLVGLSFIVLFSVILCGREPDMPSTPEKTMVSQAPHQRTDNTQVIRSIELPEAPPVTGPSQVDANKAMTADDTSAANEQPAPAETPVAEAPTKPEPVTETTLVDPAMVDNTPKEPQMADPRTADAGEPNADEAEAQVKMASAEGMQMVPYTIKKGDTLVKIAKTVCGESTNKTIDRIYEANRDQMTSKSACVVGKTLQVPVVKKDKNADTLLKTGKFEQVAHNKTSKHPACEEIADDNLPSGTETKAAEVTKPAGKPASKDAGKTNPKNGIKGSPKDALAQRTEPVTDDSAPQTPGETPKAALKKGNKSDPKGELAGALDAVTKEITANTPAKSETATETPASTVALSVEKESLRRYQVQKGDTWYKMAARFLGDSKRWKELYAMNDDILPDATKLRTGVKIRVPATKGSVAVETVQ